MVNAGKIEEAVREAKRWEDNKMEELTLHWPDRGKILWGLGQYCETQGNLPAAFEFYREVGGNYFEQASERAGKIAEWRLYLNARGEIKLSDIERFTYQQLTPMDIKNIEKQLDESSRFLSEAYVSEGKPNFNKSLDALKTLLGLKSTPIYASPLSNMLTTPSSAIAATPVTVTTTTAITKQM